MLMRTLSSPIAVRPQHHVGSRPGESGGRRSCRGLNSSGVWPPHPPRESWTQAVAPHRALGFGPTPSAQGNANNPWPQRAGIAAHPTRSAVEEVRVCTCALPPIGLPLRSRLALHSRETDLGRRTLLPLLRTAARRETNCIKTPIARHAVEDRRIAPIIATDRAHRPLGAAAAPHEGVEHRGGEEER